MRLAEQEWDTGVDWFEHPASCGSADYFSRMWDYGTLGDIVPIFGPHPVYRALDVIELDRSLQGLASSFRDVCLYELKRVDLASVIVRDEWEFELRQVADRFYFKNTRAVSDFLELHRPLMKVLFEVRQRVDQYFGPETLTNLELFIDPEEDESGAKLFALILSQSSLDEASSRLDRLDEEWWLDQPYEIRRLMNIDVEYVDASV